MTRISFAKEFLVIEVQIAQLRDTVERRLAVPVGRTYEVMSGGPLEDAGSSSKTSSGYILPPYLLQEKNLQYVLKLPHLPPLPKLRGLLFLSEGTATDSLEQQRPNLEKKIDAFTTEQHEALGELTRALALILSSPSPEAAPGSASTIVKTPRQVVEDRILLASCYTTSHRLKEARMQLEVAKEEVRKIRDADKKAQSNDRPRQGSEDGKLLQRQVLEALAVIAILEDHRQEAERFLRWRDKA